MVGRTNEMEVKTTKSICGVLALLAFSACSTNDDQAGNDNRFWTVTLNASMGDAATRALSAEGHVITASFAVNDEVVVVDADGKTTVGTLKAQTAGTSTTLEGTLDAATLAEGEVVTLRYRSTTANYDGQVGTLAGIAASQDYAEGTLTVSSTSPLTFASNSVTLAAKQSITKFSFTDGSSAVNVSSFGIAAPGLVQSIAAGGSETVGAVTGTLASPSSEVYVALRNESGSLQTYSFYVRDDAGNWYTGTKKANLAKGKNYVASVTLTKLPALGNSHAEGTIGVVDGLPAIVVAIGEVKKAVALINAGAFCPEDYGNYFTFDNRASGLIGSWYVPSQEEMTSLNTKAKSWATQNGVSGYLYTIAGTTLFLPAAGYYDNDTGNDSDAARVLFAVSTGGYYWSSTDSSTDGLAISLSFGSSANDIYSEYKVNELSVRPFHALN